MTDKRLLIASAQETVQQLCGEVEESVGLAVLVPASGEIEVVARCEGKGVSVRLEINTRYPLHITAPGKAILAMLAPDQRKPIIDVVRFDQYTDNTITNRKHFVQELEETAKNGYALDRGEGNDGVNCVGVPVFDAEGNVAAALFVSSFSNRLNENNFSEVAASLKLGAEKLQRKTAAATEDNQFAQFVIDECKRYMDENFRQDIDLELLADKHRVKYAWFRNHFKKLTGLSPKQYLLQAKMDEAMRLLKETDLSIKEIASALGYSSQNYFSSAFHRRFGSYPSEIRKN